MTNIKPKPSQAVLLAGTLFRGPYNKDYSILGSILGSPYFGKLPYPVLWLVKNMILM